MAKRNGTKIPPFPSRWEARYFGACGINMRNGWLGLPKGILDDCAPPADAGIVFEPLDLDWPDGTPAFPLDRERPDGE